VDRIFLKPNMANGRHFKNQQIAIFSHPLKML